MFFDIFKSRISIDKRKPKYRIVKHIVPKYGTAKDVVVFWTVEKRGFWGWSTIGYDCDPFCDRSTFSTLEKAEEMLTYCTRKPTTEIQKMYY